MDVRLRSSSPKKESLFSANTALRKLSLACGIYRLQAEQNLENPPDKRYEKQNSDDLPDADHNHPGENNANRVLNPQQDITYRATETEKDNNDEYNSNRLEHLSRSFHVFSSQNV